MSLFGDPTEGCAEDMIVSDHDPGGAKVALRSELSFSLRKSDDLPFMMVQDEVNSQYFRLGINEYKMAQLFDGQRTLRQVVKEATELLGEDKVESGEVSRLAGWLVQSGLAQVTDGSLSSAAPPTSTGQKLLNPLNQAAKLGQWNPLFLKIALPNPERILAYFAPLFTHFFSRYFFLIWCGVCAYGTYNVMMHWDRFWSSLQDVFARDNWLYLMIVWIVLKIVHEGGHAIACMRYGGTVTRCGLMFIVFSPIAWVDVTSSWSFRSRWRRIIVSAAGMYVEFFIAAVAAIVWARTDNAMVASICRNVVLSASVTTLLFNLNFLMRFDGYYILTDLLDIQNLYQSGQQYTQYARRRYLFGLQTPLPKFTGMKLSLVRLYGIGAMLWRVTFCVGILFVAAQLFRGAGIVLAVFSGLVWFGVPFARFLVTLCVGSGRDRPNLARFGLVSLVGIVLLGVALVLPWPGQTVAHGVVQYSPLRPIRVNSPGFVSTIEARIGQQVQVGDLLLTLENQEVTNELADLEFQIQIQEIAARIAHRDNEMAEYEAIKKKLDSLQDQRLRVAGKVATLDVRAPIDGTVIAPDLKSLEGKYVESGTDLLSVGSTGEKEVRVSIEQSNIEAFRDQSNSDVRLSIRGHRLRKDAARLERVNPRATRRVLHGGLAATSGGPLAVQQSADGGSEDLVLVEPHFEGVVKVPKTLSSELRSGEICKVSLGRGHQRVYEKLYAIAKSYFDAKAAGSVL